MFESLVKKIPGAGYIVEFESETSPQPAVPTVPVSPVSPTTQSSAAPAFDAVLLEGFRKAVAARKTPYTALLEKETILHAAIADDTMRTKAAFAMIVAEGRNLDSIIQAIDLHISDVTSELTEIKGAAETASKTKVMSLRSAATQCNDLRDSNQSKIDDLQKQIEALQSEANASNQKSLDLSNQADAAEAEIAKVVANATAAADFIKQELQVKKTTLATTLST